MASLQVAWKTTTHLKKPPWASTSTMNLGVFSRLLSRTPLQHLATSSISSTALGPTPRTSKAYSGISQNVAQFETLVTVDDMYALQKQLMEWTSAFNPLFDSSRTPAGQKDYVACSILRIQSISLRIILGGNMSLVPQFPIPAPDKEAVKGWCKGIVSLASDLVTDPRFLRAYIFGLGIFPALFVVAFTAPDREMGKEAVKLMRASKGRSESTWDAEQVASLSEAVWKIREMACDGEVVSIEMLKGVKQMCVGGKEI